MRFLTATWSVVASLVVVLAMFSFAPSALAGDPWSDGYNYGKTVGIGEGKNACKTELSKCTSKDSASSNTTCKECLPDGDYFVTNTPASGDIAGIQAGCKKNPASCGISMEGGEMLKLSPSDTDWSLWVDARFLSGDDSVDSKKVLKWRIIIDKAEVNGGDHITVGSFEKDSKNPDVFVKIYRFKDGRVNVEFFFFAVDPVRITSCLATIGNCDPTKTNTKLTTNNRYILHEYAPSQSPKGGEQGVVVNDKAATGTAQGTDDMSAIEAAFDGIKITGKVGTESLKWFKKDDPSDINNKDKVFWGFLAKDGRDNDPLVFVKFYYSDSAKVTYVNFFHTSPDPITISSGRTVSGKLEKVSPVEISSSNRYSRHEYRKN